MKGAITFSIGCMTLKGIKQKYMFVIANQIPGVYSVASASQQKSNVAAWWYHCKKRTCFRFRIRNTVSSSSGIFERQKRLKASIAGRPSLRLMIEFVSEQMV